MSDERIRKGTGIIVKYFKVPGESLLQLKTECAALSDTDIADLVGGIESGSLTY